MDVVQPIRELLDREEKGESVLHHELAATTLEELGRASTPMLERTFCKVDAATQRAGYAAIVTMREKEGGGTVKGDPSRGGGLNEEQVLKAKQAWQSSLQAEQDRCRERLRQKISFGSTAFAEGKTGGDTGRLSHSVRPSENHHSASFAEAREEVNQRQAIARVKNQLMQYSPASGATGATVMNLGLGEQQRYEDWVGIG